MKIIYCKVREKAVVKEIDGSLESMQNAVDGWIEMLPIANDVSIVCNENGKINGSEANRYAYMPNGDVLDIIFGDFFIVGSPEDSADFESLTDEQVEKYLPEYETPIQEIWAESEVGSDW